VVAVRGGRIASGGGGRRRRQQQQGGRAAAAAAAARVRSMQHERLHPRHLLRQRRVLLLPLSHGVPEPRILTPLLLDLAAQGVQAGSHALQSSQQSGHLLLIHCRTTVEP